MIPGKMGLLVGVMLLCFARSVHAAALGEDCSSGTGSACADLNAMVCDPTDETCRVKADGVQTNCNGDNGLCPENAACGTDKCTCNAGFIVDATSGLCTVQDADCSSDACGDTTNYVCDPDAGNKCKVKADGAKTDCSSRDENCATHATCAAGGTCSCNTVYKVLTTGLCTAVIGSTCENNAACSSVLTNSECVITYPCTKGVCACSSGYGGTDCLTLGYDKTCPTSGAEKCNTGIGLACDAGKCACSTSGKTYRSEIGICTDQKLLGETCTGTGTGDCYTTANAACDSDKKCTCSSGYTQDGQVCRLPYAGETCSATCGVNTGAPLISETSQQTPACTASKCDCGTHEQVSRKIGTTCYKVCLSTGGGTTAVGQTCNNFNECASKVCAQCPDDADAICYNAPCSGSTFSGSILVCSIILFSIFI